MNVSLSKSLSQALDTGRNDLINGNSTYSYIEAATCFDLPFLSLLITIKGTLRVCCLAEICIYLKICLAAAKVKSTRA